MSNRHVVGRLAVRDRPDGQLTLLGKVPTSGPGADTALSNNARYLYVLDVLNANGSHGALSTPTASSRTAASYISPRPTPGSPTARRDWRRGRPAAGSPIRLGSTDSRRGGQAAGVLARQAEFCGHRISRTMPTSSLQSDFHAPPPASPVCGSRPARLDRSAPWSSSEPPGIDRRPPPLAIRSDRSAADRVLREEVEDRPATCPVFSMIIACPASSRSWTVMRAVAAP